MKTANDSVPMWEEIEMFIASLPGQTVKNHKEHQVRLPYPGS
jgi:hypothetical protein